ncbi:Dynein heavy chain 3, axonemal [Amphibalanus amphitrite]|uniref:folate gamma-glutamyl hydrolase n=1 Tax=Amphibalanus amphitrite TaxID=1232801 RepID=A0A6A4X1P0_AMPAM|nr:Dynein heavy chain 3, axonemal [Amphibalanus amphitrite]
MLSALVLLSLGSLVAGHDRPIIGILAQETTRDIDGFFPELNYTSYVQASYVQFVEAAGARAAPVFIHRSQQYYEDMFRQLNGLLLPGGNSLLGSSGFGSAARAFWELAHDHPEVYFPMWGTCLGHEELAYLAAILEHRDLPIYGTQFHPEKAAFEWSTLERVDQISHAPSAVSASQFLGEFLVSEARRSENVFEITKGYGMTEWREDLKLILRRTGAEGKASRLPVRRQSGQIGGEGVQVKDEAMVEDLNMILNLGDVPNLYAADEKAEILEKMQGIAKDMGRKVDSAPLALYNFFIELVRANLHVVIAMSPIGDAFRNRLRMFPSLINCCTIDWFTAWPEDALERVAHHFLRDVPDMEDQLRLGCVFVCQHFHESVRLMSQRYLAELGRHNYVTPTSYLELIMAFKALLQKKRDEILTLRQRYVTGLEKLEFAASQVSVMQDELTSLQPQLIETSAQTEKLMIKIEQDTMEVEAKKEVSRRGTSLLRFSDHPR